MPSGSIIASSVVGISVGLGVIVGISIDDGAVGSTVIIVGVGVADGRSASVGAGAAGGIATGRLLQFYGVDLGARRD